MGVYSGLHRQLCWICHCRDIDDLDGWGANSFTNTLLQFPAFILKLSISFSFQQEKKKTRPPQFCILIAAKIQNMKLELPHYAFGRSGEEANFKTKN